MLREGQADAALLYAPPDELGGLDTETLLTEAPVAVLPASGRVLGPAPSWCWCGGDRTYRRAAITRWTGRRTSAGPGVYQIGPSGSSIQVNGKEVPGEWFPRLPERHPGRRAPR